MLVMENRTNYLRRDLAVRLLRLILNDRPLEEVDAIPMQILPKNKATYRCCIFKDRAMLRYRLMALMGLSLEQSREEPYLKTHLQHALEREKVESPVLTVLHEACSACIKTSYQTTELCRGCVARPCTLVCPRKAISFKDGRSWIDPKLCINCGKCREVCPYNAITYTPVPCEAKCPVGAVKKDEEGKEYIDYDLCIACGRCTRTCPFGAIMERSQLLDVVKRLKRGDRVSALLAPSFVGQFPGDPLQTVQALRELGFKRVYDVASGADTTAEEEAKEFIERREKGETTMGTSCCPAYVEAVNKHAPEFKKMVSSTPTPMAYTASDAKKEDPDCCTVFIGPCIAKKQEALGNRDVDFVLTFEELGALFMAAELEISDLDPSAFDGRQSQTPGRGFPRSSGVSGAVASKLPDGEELNSILIDGLDRKGINKLKIAAKGKLAQGLIEVMSCQGGCIHGPGVAANPKVSEKALRSYLSDSTDA